MRTLPIKSVLACIVLLFASAGTLLAQADLRVRITFENGRQATQGIRVSLMTPVGSTIAQSYTNDFGEAQFKIGPGLYRIRVTSPEIETAESVAAFQIQDREEVHFEYMQVKRLKPDSGAAKGGSPTVSTTQLTIPDNAQEEFKKGTDALDHNDLGSAQKHFEAALAIFPRYSGALSNLGIIAVQRGDAAQARTYFEQAVEADPTDADSALNLSRMLFPEQSYKRIEDLLGKVAGAHPENAEVLTLLAQAELLDNQPQLALANAQRVHNLSDHLRFSSAHIIAGTALQKLNRPKEAVQEYELFLKETPNARAAEQVRAAVAALKAKTD